MAEAAVGEGEGEVVEIRKIVTVQWWRDGESEWAIIHQGESEGQGVWQWMVAAGYRHGGKRHGGAATRCHHQAQEHLGNQSLVGMLMTVLKLLLCTIRVPDQTILR